MISAVEWLYETLWKQNDYSLPSNILEEAKEMEKEQIIEACKSSDNTDFWIKYDSYEQYYNEIIKKQ